MIQFRQVQPCSIQDRCQQDDCQAYNEGYHWVSMPSLRGFRLFVGRVRVEQAGTEAQRRIHVSLDEYQEGEGKQSSGTRARSAQTCVAVGRLLAEQTIAVADVANQGIVVNNYGICKVSMNQIPVAKFGTYHVRAPRRAARATCGRLDEVNALCACTIASRHSSRHLNMSQEEKDLDELQSDLSEEEDDSRAFHIGERLTMPKARLYTTQELHSTPHSCVLASYTDCIN